MKTVSVTQARNNFAQLLNQVAYGSEQILIVKMGKPIAAIVDAENIKSGIIKMNNAAPPSHTAGTITMPNKFAITKVFRALSKSYDTKSLLGR